VGDPGSIAAGAEAIGHSARPQDRHAFSNAHKIVLHRWASGTACPPRPRSQVTKNQTIINACEAVFDAGTVVRLPINAVTSRVAAALPVDQDRLFQGDGRQLPPAPSHGSRGVVVAVLELQDFTQHRAGDGLFMPGTGTTPSSSTARSSVCEVPTLSTRGRSPYRPGGGLRARCRAGSTPRLRRRRPASARGSRSASGAACLEPVHWAEVGSTPVARRERGVGVPVDRLLRAADRRRACGERRVRRGPPEAAIARRRVGHGGRPARPEPVARAGPDAKRRRRPPSLRASTRCAPVEDGSSDGSLSSMSTTASPFSPDGQDRGPCFRLASEALIRIRKIPARAKPADLVRRGARAGRHVASW
jgi:hypothetical protein